MKLNQLIDQGTSTKYECDIKQKKNIVSIFLEDGKNSTIVIQRKGTVFIIIYLLCAKFHRIWFQSVDYAGASYIISSGRFR